VCQTREEREEIEERVREKHIGGRKRAGGKDWERAGEQGG
jgi:hypothetical protein